MPPCVPTAWFLRHRIAWMIAAAAVLIVLAGFAGGVAGHAWARPVAASGGSCHGVQVANQVLPTIVTVFSDGPGTEAKLVGRDPQSDLAVLKVSDPKQLPFIAQGDSSTLHVGQPVVGLGAPLGLSSSVTAGMHNQRPGPQRAGPQRQQHDRHPGWRAPD